MQGTAFDRDFPVCRWDDPQRRASVLLNCRAAEGIRSDVIDAFLSLPKRGVETGGLLLGRFESAGSVLVRVEEFRPVPIEHRYGPSYSLSEADHTLLKRQIEREPEGRNRVVGVYRSFTGRDPVMEPADEETLRLLLSGAGGIALLLRPLAADKCVAAFSWWQKGELFERGNPFLFDTGEMSRAESLPTQAQTEQVLAAESASPRAAAVRERLTNSTVAASSDSLPDSASSGIQGERLHREPALAKLPDWAPHPAAGSRARAGQTTDDSAPSAGQRFRLPLVACVALVTGAMLGYEWWNLTSDPAPPPPSPSSQSADRMLVARPETTPPLGVPSPPPTEQTSAPPAQPVSQPVARPAPQLPATPHRREPRPARASPIRKTAPAVVIPPVVLHEVHPGIPDGIRARIPGQIVVPVDVLVNESGRVIDTTPEARGDALYNILADHAVAAARFWRFDPARSRSGARVQAHKTIYFSFTP